MNKTAVFYKLLSEVVETANLAYVDDWKNSNFIHLSDLIFEKTNNTIHSRTLRRIFDNKQGGKSIVPKLGTLNILALFCGYADWHQYESMLSSNTKSRGSGLFSGNFYKYVILGFILLVGTVLLLRINDEVKSTDVKLARFDSLYYNSPIKYDAVFHVLREENFVDTLTLSHTLEHYIFENSNSSTNIIPGDKNYYRKRLYEPGLYQVNLHHNESKVDHMRYFVTNGKWQGAIDAKDSVFGYYDLPFKNGVMQLNEAIQQKASEICANYKTVFTYIDKIPLLLDKSEVQIRCKHDYKTTEECNQFKLMLYGKKNSIKLLIAEEKCFNETVLKIGDNRISGKYNEVELFNTNYKDWQVYKFQCKNDTCSFGINDEIKFKLAYTKKLDTLMGIKLWYIGKAEVAYVRCYDKDNSLIYNDEFE